MLIGGPQTIDVNDWERNTEYKGYSTSCQVVRWFWEVVGELNQEYLKNLLHYCTGTNRVPVLGFKYL
jgi:E3 ubiquitin-protein ligase NEDD4